MFEKLKNWIKKDTNYSKENNELFNLFYEQVNIINSNENIPQKVKISLEKLIIVLKSIDMMRISIEGQSQIEKILSREIPYQIENYLILPKAHAVSILLENGKTAKQTLIDVINKDCKLIEDTWNEAVEKHVQNLVNKEKSKKETIKKDFFDL
jgi:hypothetical protein